MCMRGGGSEVDSSFPETLILLYNEFYLLHSE